MAKHILITYDLKNPGRNYMELYDTIKGCGEWQHPLESVWFVKVSNLVNVDDLYERVRSKMDDNDCLFIVDVTGRPYNGWLAKTFWTWFKEE